MKTMKLKVALYLLISLTVAACATTDEADDDKAQWSAEQFYTEAKEKLDDGNYEGAIKQYQQLESRYPFGKYAPQAQLDVAYAYYKYDEPESSLAAINRFIKLHPRNPHVDYAYYLRGLVNYNRDIGLIDRFLPTDQSQRDPGSTEEAYRNFDELMNKFPRSQYIPDAQQRMIELRNNTAMHEVHVARYYMKRKAYLAAANRCSVVLEKYQRTPAVPVALEIMKQAYQKLELSELEYDVNRVYVQNYAEGKTLPPQKPRSIGRRVWDWVGLDEN